MALIRDSGPSQSEHLGGARIANSYLFYTELALFCWWGGLDNDGWSDGAGVSGPPPWFRKRPRV